MHLSQQLGRICSVQLLFIALVHEANAFVKPAVAIAHALEKPAVSNGPVDELQRAAVGIANATSTIQTAASLAPESGHDQEAVAVLLELEQCTEDLAQEVHALWVNAIGNQPHSHLRSLGGSNGKRVHEFGWSAWNSLESTPEDAAPTSNSVAALERTHSVVAKSVVGSQGKGNLTVISQGNLTSQWNLTVEKPRSKKGMSVPGLRIAKGVILQVLQHVQSAARAERLGRIGGDVVPTAQLVMDRSRDLYTIVEVATARVAGGKDAQTRVEKKLQKIQSGISQQSIHLADDALAMTRELRLVKHIVREAVGGSMRGEVARNARKTLKANQKGTQ